MINLIYQNTANPPRNGTRSAGEIIITRTVFVQRTANTIQTQISVAISCKIFERYATLQKMLLLIHQDVGTGNTVFGPCISRQMLIVRGLCLIWIGCI